MSYSVSGTTITLTRGDSFYAQLSITDADGNEYVPSSDDYIRFAMKKKITDDEPLLIKEIPYDTLILTLDPEDTSSLSFGSYIYDVELTTSDGFVNTFITKSTIKITEEVY